MVKAIAKARERARACIEGLYEGVCNVYTFASQYDKITHSTKTIRSDVATVVPCRVSYSSTAPANQTDTVAALSQTITLYLAPEVDIPSGSFIEVTQTGVTTKYQSSGKSRVYPTHQEVSLTLTENKA